MEHRVITKEITPQNLILDQLFIVENYLYQLPTPPISPPYITHYVSKDSTLALQTQLLSGSPMSPYQPLHTMHSPQLLLEETSLTMKIRSRDCKQKLTRNFFFFKQ